MSQIPVGELMTIGQACEHLHTTRQTIYGAIARGALTAVPVLGGRRLLRSEVERYQPQGFQGKRPSKNAPPAGTAARRRGRPPKNGAGQDRAKEGSKGD